MKQLILLLLVTHRLFAPLPEYEKPILIKQKEEHAPKNPKLIGQFVGPDYISYYKKIQHQHCTGLLNVMQFYDGLCYASHYIPDKNKTVIKSLQSAPEMFEYWRDEYLKQEYAELPPPVPAYDLDGDDQSGQLYKVFMVLIGFHLSFD